MNQAGYGGHGISTKLIMEGDEYRKPEFRSEQLKTFFIKYSMLIPHPRIQQSWK